MSRFLTRVRRLTPRYPLVVLFDEVRKLIDQFIHVRLVVFAFLLAVVFVILFRVLVELCLHLNIICLNILLQENLVQRMRPIQLIASLKIL